MFKFLRNLFENIKIKVTSYKLVTPNRLSKIIKYEYLGNKIIFKTRIYENWFNSLSSVEKQFILKNKSKKFKNSYNTISYLFEYLLLFSKSKDLYYKNFLFYNEIKNKFNLSNSIEKENLVISNIEYMLSLFDKDFSYIKKSVKSYYYRYSIAKNKVVKNKVAIIDNKNSNRLCLFEIKGKELQYEN